MEAGNREIGHLIARLRKFKGMTQKQLAAALHVTDKAISKWETGGGMPDIATLTELCKVLGITVDELLAADGSRVLPGEKTLWKGWRILGILLSIGVVLGVLGVHGGYFLLLRPRGFQFGDAAGFWGLNIALFLGGAALTLLLFRKKSIRILGIALSFLLGAALIFADTAYGLGSEKMVSTSPTGAYTCILGKEGNGTVTVYHHRFLWFVKGDDTLPYTVDGMMKTQWITGDTCAITYRSTDGKTHQYVATYGNRGSDISYTNPVTSISGEWMMNDTNTAGHALSVGAEGVVVTYGQKTEKYSYSDCVAFGESAVVLCKNGLPKWTVVIADDAVVDDSGLISSGEIYLCPVDMDKTSPVAMVCTTPRVPQTPDLSDSTTRGQSVYDEMSAIIKADPTLSHTEDNNGYHIVEAKEDLYELVCDGVKTLLSENSTEYDDKAVITHVTITGDAGDFYAQVKFTDTVTKVTNREETETVDMEWNIRYIRGGSHYVMGRVVYGADGTVGLTSRDTTEKDMNVEIFIPGSEK